jgi:deoxyadenosine/deoxycytidine kinase
MLFNFICIEGNIGIGKTTLVKKLAAYYNRASFFEEFNENPWLPLFYQNPADTALALELSFLTDRCKQLLQIEKRQLPQIISDYCLDKCLLFTEANLSKEDFSAYKKLFDRISATIKKPDLVIVLHASVEALVNNIKLRGRTYEQNMDPAYLETLNEKYIRFFSEERAYTVLHIFTDIINDEVYEAIFREIVSFIQSNPEQKINTIRL